MTEPGVITFDCYGTLLQWRESLHEALGGILAVKGSIAVDDFVAAFHEIRHVQTRRLPYRSYKAILANSLEDALARYGLEYREADAERLMAAIRAIPPFPEVPGALSELRRNHRIAIISNSDADLMTYNVAALGVPFDWVFVAEDARAYKPSLEFFRHVLARVACAPDEVVHVGASLSLDIEPAASLGMRRVWINRLGQRGDPRWMPYETLEDLSRLPAAIAALAPPSAR